MENLSIVIYDIIDISDNSIMHLLILVICRKNVFQNLTIRLSGDHSRNFATLRYYVI